MKYFIKHKAAILISFVIGIVIFYMQPILLWFGEAVVDFCIMTSDTFSEMYYESIAINDTNAFSALNNYILSLAMGIALLVSVKYIKQRKRDLIRKVKNQLTEIDKLNSKIDGDDTNNQLTEKDIQAELAFLEESVNETQDRLEKRDFRFIILTIITPIFILAMMGNYVMMRSVSIENTSFRNKMDILLPYVGQEKINKLKSQWCLMNNSKDYNAINKEIKSALNEYLK